MTAEQINGGLLTLRDVYGRSLFERYGHEPSRLFAALGVYEPVANKILEISSINIGTNPTPLTAPTSTKNP